MGSAVLLLIALTLVSCSIGTAITRRLKHSPKYQSRSYFRAFVAAFFFAPGIVFIFGHGIGVFPAPQFISVPVALIYLILGLYELLAHVPGEGWFFVGICVFNLTPLALTWLIAYRVIRGPADAAGSVGRKKIGIKDGLSIIGTIVLLYQFLPPAIRLEAINLPVVRGVVTDAVTSKPLPGIFVSRDVTRSYSDFHNSRREDVHHTAVLTDSYGNFVLPPATVLRHKWGSYGTTYVVNGKTGNVKGAPSDSKHFHESSLEPKPEYELIPFVGSIEDCLGNENCVTRNSKFARFCNGRNFDSDCRAFWAAGGKLILPIENDFDVCTGEPSLVRGTGDVWLWSFGNRLLLTIYASDETEARQSAPIKCIEQLLGGIGTPDGAPAILSGAACQKFSESLTRDYCYYTHSAQSSSNDTYCDSISNELVPNYWVFDSILMSGEKGKSFRSMCFAARNLRELQSLDRRD
jgi:hypothetical protein